MLHVLARDGFEDQPTLRPVTKKEALGVIRLGAPVTVATRSHLPPARSFHEKNRSFAVLMPDSGTPQDAYFVKAQLYDAERQDSQGFTASVTLKDDGVTCRLLQPEDIAPPLDPYLACLRALDTGLDAFEALVIEIDGTQDARADWVSDQDRRVLNALLDHKDHVLTQLEDALTKLCQTVAAEQADVAQRHAQRTARWSQVKPGTMLVELRTNGDHLAAHLARKIAPISMAEHDRYVVLQPGHLPAMRNSLPKLTQVVAKDLGVADQDDLLGFLTVQARKNAHDYPDLCAPYVTGPHEYRGIADPSLPVDFSHTYRHLSLRVPQAHWKADGTARPPTHGHLWQIGGKYGDQGIPGLQLPGEAESNRLRPLHVSKRRGPWALGFVDDRQYGRHLVASDRVLDCLPADARVAPSETVDRPDLPQGLSYLDLPHIASGLRFDPEYLTYRRRADLLRINPYHRNAEATDQFSWRSNGLDESTPDDALVMDAPRHLPEIWRASDFGSDGLDYIMISAALMQTLTTRGLMVRVPSARIGIAAPA